MNIAIILSGIMDSRASRMHRGQCLVQPVDMWSSSAEVQLPGKRANSTLLLNPWRWLNTALHPELRKKYPSFATHAVDNSAAVKISEQLGVSKLTKHFAFAAHRIRDEVEHLRLRCKHVSTDDQTADIFTKPWLMQ